MNRPLDIHPSQQEGIPLDPDFVFDILVRQKNKITFGFVTIFF